MKQNDFRGIAVAVLVFALGIIAVGFTGCDFLEDFVRMQGAEEPPTVDFFSGVSTEEEVDSAIDAIRAAAGKDEVSLTLKKGEEPELVQLGEAGRDLPAEGLVLNLDNSPASVTIEGNGQVVDLTGSPGSPLITVENGVTLTLKNITLKGLKSGDGNDTDNTRPLVLVYGELIMGADAVITDNTNIGDATWGTTQYNAGGGVMVSGGTFKMTGGAIKNNRSKQTEEETNLGGGGVGVVNGGRFIMTGGTIEHNAAQETSDWNGGAKLGGGGVMVYKGTFTMNGGTITANTADRITGLPGFSSMGFGGGVSVNYHTGGRFVKTEGSSIGGNTADYGNQVFVLTNYDGGAGKYTYRVLNSVLEAPLSVLDGNHSDTQILGDPLWEGGNP